MGRIADALKRAEQERRVARGLSTGRYESPALLTTPLLGPEPAEPATLTTDEEAVQEPRPLVQGLSESLVPYYDHSSLITEQ